MEGQKKKEWQNYLIVILFWQITIQSSKAMNPNKKFLKQCTFDINSACVEGHTK